MIANNPSPWLVSATDPLVAAGCSWHEIKQAIQTQLRRELKHLEILIVASKPRRRSLWQLLAGIEKKAGLDQDARDAWARLEGDNAVRACLDEWKKKAANVDCIGLGELAELTLVALEAPGIVAGRALSRHSNGPLKECLRDAVQVSWNGLRTYLGDPVFLPDTTRRHTAQSIIRGWVRDGCLESVLDEHLAYSKRSPSGKSSSPQELSDALQIHAGSVTIHPIGPRGGKGSFRVRCHAAVPFGSTEREPTSPGRHVSRSDMLRIAFNSPFRPFILTTTSVGQEGLDFHTWCSQVVHWDLCSSPVDLEQREGRIQRYLGLSIRRRLAELYGRDAFAASGCRSGPRSLWEMILEFASRDLLNGAGLSPWWVLEGAHVQNHVLTMENSRDQIRYNRLRVQRSLYRLALGQPKQEEFIHSLEMASAERRAELPSLTLSLSPSTS